MYDFGNSAFAVLYTGVFSVFYARHVVGNEHGQGDLWLGRLNSVAMLTVALSSPFLGGVADHAGVRKRMLGLYTAVAVGAILAFPAIEPGAVATGFVLGALAASRSRGDRSSTTPTSPTSRPRRTSGASRPGGSRSATWARSSPSGSPPC